MEMIVSLYDDNMFASFSRRRPRIHVLLSISDRLFVQIAMIFLNLTYNSSPIMSHRFATISVC